MTLIIKQNVYLPKAVCRCLWHHCEGRQFVLFKNLFISHFRSEYVSVVIILRQGQAKREE